MRPLVLDVLETLLPLAAGLLAFVAGRYVVRLPRAWRMSIIGLAVFIVLASWPAHFWLKPWIGPWLFRVGGEATPALWPGLFLLGVVAALPSRTLGQGFIISIVSVVGFILLLEGGGRLVWRFGFPEMWENQADAAGCVRQSIGVTCTPAAAVMLLHHHGIPASEGEMAYLANTSLVGTNFQSMAYALTLKVEEQNRRARVRWSDYESCLEQQEPFVAGVKVPGVGSHALYVERLSPETVMLVDPLDGHRKSVSHALFQSWWSGELLAIEEQP